MRTEVFIKTCPHDAEYHEYCMRSFAKFCDGFDGPTVISSEEPNGYLVQQCYKLEADIYCPSADFILVTDSDTLFTEPVTPESFMRDGKPIWYQTPFDGAISGDPNVRCWVDVMQKFHGAEPEFEFMRRQPFMFPAWILKELRDYCVKKHGRTMRQYVMESGRFSEWNVIGMFAWLHHRDAFSWINTDEELPPAKVFQAWSHDPIEKNIERFNEILQ